jgi:hypothetical protein
MYESLLNLFACFVEDTEPKTLFKTSCLLIKIGKVKDLIVQINILNLLYNNLFYITS